MGTKSRFEKFVNGLLNASSQLGKGVSKQSYNRYRRSLEHTPLQSLTRYSSYLAHRARNPSSMRFYITVRKIGTIIASD